ncbi:hypothetical protein KSF_103390 [Reticulibacter mediterranei]|uniref:Uncharacterized protein n=1 Tax=Reticulibacter mediterranei TaxID=2778369 RepID=A0A8J3J2B6_9CHLR|nr:hypothetical protein [Reticulibacter mediterranei]GHP00292.1 hypothetical protein KSF_103390 [Reticulibacter mediterranei]
MSTPSRRAGKDEVGGKSGEKKQAICLEIAGRTNWEGDLQEEDMRCKIEDKKKGRAVVRHL